MSNNLFYSHNREIRGGFLEAMFEICTKTNKMFCGIASSYDTLVSSLPECWLKMTKSQRSTYSKKKKDEYLSMMIRRKQ